MPKVSDLSGVKVFVVKDVRRPKEGQPTTKLSKLGKVHMAVFTPDGRRVVGFLVRRPDVAGMVKREDVFLAVDSYAPVEKGIRVTRGDDAFDDAARERLHVNWDACIMWAGMDAKTSDGKLCCYLGEGRFTDDKIPDNFFGCAGVVEIANLQNTLEYIGHQGYRHHVGVTAGHVAASVREAFTHYLGYDLTLV